MAVFMFVLGIIAEREWEKTNERREAGIAAMPVDENGRKVSSRTGRGFGRTAKDVDLMLKPGENVTDACERLGISRTTYYRKLNSCHA
jgi:DNA invertase Pin-like site-specific DNA recombinase